MREMKDSGIVWIGNIPYDWDVMRIKNVAWLKGRIGWDGLKAEEFQDDGPYLITGTDFENGHVNWDTCVHITSERYAEDELLHIKEGDLLITKDGTIGKLAIVKNCPNKVSLNSGVMIIRNDSEFKYDNKYMYYVLMSSVFTEWFESEQKPGSTIRHLYQHQFSEFKFPFPSIDEQKVIAHFLDSKCAAIDEAISRQKKAIEKLEEYKNSIIQHAVTKGLDSLVDFKHSGISKIGLIPEHWRVVAIKRICSMQSGNNLTSLDILDEGMYPVYGGNGKRGYYNDYTNCGEHVLIGRQGALAGNVHYVDEMFWATDHAVVVYGTPLVTMKYLYYMFIGMNLNQYAYETAAQPGLAVGKIRSLVMCVPSNID